MSQAGLFFGLSARVLMAGGVVVGGAVGLAQTKPSTMPDAQVEANVLKALASAPQLANQAITTTTVYGTVTMSGTVADEPSRDTAEHLVANAAGVQKVVDQLTIGPVAAAGPDAASAVSNQVLQSDGTMAPAPTAQDTGNAPMAPPQAGAQTNGQYAPPAPQYPQGGQYPPAYGQPYGPAQGGYPPPQPFVAQKGGDAVVVPAGALLRVRVNEAMDSKHTAPGTAFDGVVLNDIVAGGSIAIPRGATVKGTVVEVHKAGDFKGKGELKLQLTQVELGGRIYPVATDFWLGVGADKTGNTVGNTVGLGATGALIGAVAGGGLGAAVGAGVGGLAGLGVSSATKRGEAVVPSEGIIAFHLTQPADVTTVSQAELNRLGAGIPTGAQPQLRPRYGYPPPPPPAYYYGPAYYRPY